MKVIVFTSCTGEKAVEAPNQLTLDDFQQGPKHVARRERELRPLLTPAAALYTGQQHVRLMRGVERQRRSLDLDLWVLSAGYGLVRGDRPLAPYEATFAGMKKPALRKWADQLKVPSAVRGVLARDFDFAIVLLGDAYLDACALDATLRLGGSVLLFAGANAARRLPRVEGLRVVTLSNREAKRFSCGLVALKGELAARLLDRLAADPTLLARLMDPATDVLGLLDGTDASRARTGRQVARANPAVDRVVSIPPSWWEKPHRQKLRYFIPEWDDLVDPDYDFLTDTHSGGSGDWANEVYAHQLYPEPNYDGILISKVVAEKSRKKKERINQLGVHRFLRVPREFPIMGDCGAFGYIHEQVPPYTTDEILDYYTRLDFDYGVSLDHLIVTATEAQKRERYELTIHNAEEFLREHRKRGLSWTPIGAVQGWDPQSYAKAAEQYVTMGYQYIGLGGLVRTSTPEIMRVLDEVHRVVPDSVSIHLFGISRLRAMTEFSARGVRSVDSASLLRRAWMGTGQNYLAPDGTLYAAIRIPEADKSFRAKRMVSEGRASVEKVRSLEQACLDVMRRLDRGAATVDEAIATIAEYDALITPDRPDTSAVLRRALEAAPWKTCDCTICQRDGVEVIIFRGNNRNRRRGFHNTYQFYRLLQRVLAGEVVWGGDEEDRAAPPASQLPLFAGAQA